jgi:hypothetical protein
MHPVKIKIDGETMMVTMSLGDASLQITGDADTLKTHFPGLFKESLLDDMAALGHALAEEAAERDDHIGPAERPPQPPLPKGGEETAGEETPIDRPPTLAELSDWFTTMALKLRKLEVRVDEWENDQTAAIAGLANRAAALEASNRETHERLNAVCAKLARFDRDAQGDSPEWGVEPQEHVRRIDALANSATELHPRALQRS